MAVPLSMTSYEVHLMMLIVLWGQLVAPGTKGPTWLLLQLQQPTCAVRSGGALPM